MIPDSVRKYVYYEEKDIILLHGNSFEIMQSLKPQSVDITITDTPYSNTTHEGARTGKGDDKLVTFNCFEPTDFVKYLISARRLTKRWFICFTDWKFLIQGEGWADFDLVRFGVWVKPNGMPQYSGDRPAMGWEAIGIFHKKGKKYWNGGGKHAVYTFNKENGEHPTTKPIGLIKQIITDFTEEDDIILDPFLGSGTTAVAAKQLGRKCIGIEIEEKYLKIAKERLRQEVLF